MRAGVGYIVLYFVWINSLELFFGIPFNSWCFLFVSCLDHSTEATLFWIQKSKPISFYSFHWCVSSFCKFFFECIFQHIHGSWTHFMPEKSSERLNVDGVCTLLVPLPVHSFFGFGFFLPKAFGSFQPRRSISLCLYVFSSYKQLTSISTEFGSSGSSSIRISINL